MHEGFKQYTPDALDECLAGHDLQPTTEIWIGGTFKCSSSEVLNALFEDLGRTIDREQGLKRFVINAFCDEKHTLQEWPLEHLVLNCHHLEELRLR